jgi:chemotaxis protein methyltransferase CheR
MAATGESLSKDLTAEEFGRFRDYIHKHSGIFLEEQKADSLRISLITRATRYALGSLREYYDMLVSDEAEFKELMNLVTINETSFFRFPQQFEAMRNAVIPEILEGKDPSNRQFRVWSAGCSTGEEPYTVSMTLLDSGLEGMGYHIEVLGTDVSTNALMKAKQGVYPARGLHTIPQDVLRRFFEPTPHGHRVVDRVRKPVSFQYHNLIKEPYPLALMGNWDIIFCRNVTIYFKLESTRRVVSNYYNSLNPGGYLFIGHSETLTSISDQFEPVEIDGVFLYRKSKPRKSFSVPDLSRPGSYARRTPERERLGRTASTARTERPARSVFAKLLVQPEPEVVAVQEPAEDIQELLGQARTASAEDRAADVRRIVDRVLELDPNNAEAHLLNAFIHADSGNLDEAVAGCNRALSVNPLLAGARYVLGIIYMRREDRMAAMSEFKRTIYIDPTFVLAHLNLANLYRQKGAVEDACREYDNTLRAMYEHPHGEWETFMGGFRPDLLAATCERSLIECRKRLENT